MDTFSLLSKEMQKKVWDMGWTHFTPIQEKTIPLIINSNKEIVISSGTASGKTEAAFLPILSLIANEAKQNLKVIYISPLKALINNQFKRIEQLTEELDIKIHRWHGDINQHNKKKFTNNPSGILQITPESLESLFINRTNHLKALFSEIDFIIIDELHAFLDNERGVHLRSLLSRMEEYSKNKPRIIGLSATLNNFEFVKKWINYKEPREVEIIDIKENNKEIYYSLMYFEKSKDGKIPIELYEDLRELTKNTRSIIFCNSRGEVEETTVLLNRLSEKEGTGESYYAHHSSIDKKEREYVEKMLSSSSEPKSVVSTSSLELGIDIGTIELVVQIDSTFSVSSLKQRIGRSGRTQDSSQFMQMYATQDDGLLQSLSVMELSINNWVEPSNGYPLPYDILFHQILSICQEKNGLQIRSLIKEIKNNSSFYFFPIIDIEKIINHMLDKDYLEKIEGSLELIVGIEGERILRSREFYSVFISEEVFDVMDGTRKVGEFDKKFKLNTGDNVILTGRLWKIADIDYSKNKIYVQKASNAKKPKYYGGPSILPHKIVEKMFNILISDENFEYADEKSLEALVNIRKSYKLNDIKKNQRVVWADKENYEFESFTGTRITNTLILMFRSLGIEPKNTDIFGRMTLPKNIKITSIFEEMRKKNWNEDELIDFVLENELIQTKFTEYIPIQMRQNMHLAHNIDLESTLDYLNENEFKIINN